MDIPGIPDTTLNLQKYSFNNEENEDSEDEMSMDSENILIEEDLQEFEELNSIGQLGY